MPVFAIDPKRVEFLRLRSWPNVQYVAIKVMQQIAPISKLKLDMDERYRLVEEEGCSNAEFHVWMPVVQLQTVHIGG